LNDIGPDTWKRFFGTLQADSSTALIEIVLLRGTAVPNPGLSGAENVVGIDDILLIPSSSRRVIVSAKANPYLAGMPNGTTAFGGTAPLSSPTSVAIAAGQVLRFNATGHTFADGGVYRSRSADGSVHLTSGLVTQSALHGISQYSAPFHGSLIGVFLDDNSPAGQTPPSALDFRTTGNVPGGVNYTSLQPVLRQVFFIGDGRNADGVEQTITAPAGATRLFLANSSRNGWDSLSGEFEVQVFDSASEPVQANRQVFIDSNFNGRLDAAEPSTLTNASGVYALPVPGTAAQIGLVGKEGEQQTFPGIPYRPFDLNTDVFPINFGSRDIALTETPRFTTSPVTTAIAPGHYRYQSFAQSPSGKQMTYALAVGPQGMSIDPSSGLVRWNPIASNRGDNEVILKATDADGKLTLQRYTINVEVNTIPVVTSTPPTIALQNVPFQYQVLAQDAEQSNLRYSLTTSPVGLTIDAATGLIQWLPSSITTESVTVKIEDQRGGVAEQTFSIAVQTAGTNHAPEFSSGPRAKAILGREFASRIGATDEDNDILSYSLVNGPSGLTISAQGEVYWQPSTSGSYDFVARVSDSRGGTDEQSYTLTVVSRAPTPNLQITSSPTTAAVVGNLFAYDVTATHGELFELVTSPTGMSIAPSRGTVRWVPTKDQLGVQTVKIRVTDVLGNMAEQSFVIAVRSSSLVPTISSAPLTEGAMGQTYVYAVAVANPSRSPLTYSLSVAPSGMQIDAALGVITWTPNSNQVGPTVVSIQVRNAVGSFSSQTFSIVVSAGAVNRPPVTVSTPSIDAVVGTPYAYTMTSDDPEGGTVTYAVRSAPNGFLIHPSTGVVTWNPVTAEIGTVAIVLTATDLQGGVAVQSIQIDVRAANRLPTIRSNPNLKVSQGALYQYDVLATDPDREPLFYSLVTAPAGMTIDTWGRIRWQTQLDTTLGGRDVVVRVVDGLGGAVTQSFTFGVVPDTLAPRITIIVGGEPVLYPWTSAPAIVRVIAADDVGLTGVELRVDGKSIELAADGTARVYFSAPGNGRLEAIATDAAGNRGTALARVSMRSGEEDGGGNPAPEATITNITDGVAVGGLVDVIGTAVSPDFERYVLSYRRIDQSIYKTILTSTTQVSTGTLGKWDTTLLENDNYVLKLEVYDTFGSFAAMEVEVSVSSNLKLGNFRLSFEDMTISVAGIPITIARTYDTLRADRDGDFGYGWRLEYRNTDLRTSLPKSGLEDIGIHTPFKQGTKVFVTLPGGKREGFTFTPDIKVLPGFGRNNNLVLASPRFTPDRGVTSTLSAGSGQLTVNEFGELYAAGGIPWNPASPDFAGYTLTTREGIQYRIDGATGLMASVVDRNGNVLSFSNDGVTSQSENIRIAIERDSKGRIRSITDPLGEKTAYTYSASGDLISVTDREGNLTKLIYRTDQVHYLDTIIDPLGRAGIRNEYDANGRISKVTNAVGSATQFTSSPAELSESTIDALGSTTTFVYDERGNVVRQIDAIGGLMEYQYDDNNNPIMEINQMGQVTRKTYDPIGNLLTESSPRGRTNTFAYSSQNNLVSIVSQDGSIVSYTYDARGNLLGTKDPSGFQTTYQYEASGRLVGTSFADGTSESIEYDIYGRIARLVDARGVTTRTTYSTRGDLLEETVITANGEITSRYEYNANSQLVLAINPLGDQRSIEYDKNGQVVARIDERRNKTLYEYDAFGNLITTVLPDGTPNDSSDNPRQRIAYDLLGRVKQLVDETGTTENYIRDSVGRVTKFELKSPENVTVQSTDFVYNADGTVQSETNRLGQSTEYRYNADGYKTHEINLLGNTWTWDYDLNGRMTKSTDPEGRVEINTYDRRGFLISIKKDDSEQRFEYDSRGNRSKSVDPLGNTTVLDFDSLGNLVMVVDAIGGVTRYKYDELGTLVSTSDANGNTTRYSRDVVGRLTSLTLPMGQTRSTRYDQVGNAIQQTDFENQTTTISYDARNRISNILLPDGIAIDREYNGRGELVKETNATGVTLKKYSADGKIAEILQPNGEFERHTYDAVGNRLQTTTRAGTTNYLYDAANRLSQVSNGESVVSSYTYDKSGLLVRQSYQNGVDEHLEYDSQGRLARKRLSGVNAELSDSHFEYDLNGNRTQTKEANGRISTYRYDSIGRLVSETVSDSQGIQFMAEYRFDASSNRIGILRTNRSQDSILITERREMTFDANNRLVRSTSDSINETRVYDKNGMLTSIQTSGSIRNYRWNSMGQLIGADLDGDSNYEIKYKYDSDGIRNEKDGPEGKVKYLVDRSTDHARIVAVTNSQGAIVSKYTFGLGIESQTEGDVVSYLHTDANQNTTSISSSQGEVAGVWSYDALGQVLEYSGSQSTPFLFAGELRDSDTGLDYLRTRYLDVSVGAFISPDGTQSIASLPVSSNTYLYAFGNTQSFVDPSGQSPLTDVVVTSAVSGILIGGLNFLFTRDPQKAAKAAVEAALFSFVVGAAFLAIPTVFAGLGGLGSAGVAATAANEAALLRNGRAIFNGLADLGGPTISTILKYKNVINLPVVATELQELKQSFEVAKSLVANVPEPVWEVVLLFARRIGSGGGSIAIDFRYAKDFLEFLKLLRAA
jgi:RHS repeat-associated protein